MKRLIVAISVVAAYFVLLGAQAPGADPINGTWRLNLEKSTYSPGPPPPASATSVRRFSTVEDGWNLFELSGVDAQGEPTFQSVAFKIDGKQYPVYTTAALANFLTTGKRTTQTRSYRRIDPDTTEFTSYTNGVAGIPTIRTVARDGKTYTETTKGKNVQGQAVHNVVVFDRVR